MEGQEQSSVVYQCVRGTDIKARYRVVAQNVPKYAEQTFYGTVLSRSDLNNFQSHLELMWDGFDDPEVVMVHWIDPSQYDAEKAVMGLAPLYRAKAEPKLGEIIDLPEYPDCEWHTSAHIVINMRMLGGVPSYTVWALAHSKEAEVDHVRFNASYKAMMFDTELLGDQRRRGWGDRGLTLLGIEQRPDGSFGVLVVVERIDGKVLRFAVPGMGGREDWGRTDDDLMRARAAVDEALVSMGLAPAHFDENLRARLYGGITNLLAVRQWVKAQVANQCQGTIPRLKTELPPAAWGYLASGGRGRGRGRGGGGGGGRGGGGRKRRGDSSDDDKSEPELESESEEEYTASGRPKRKRKAKSKVVRDYVFEGDDEYFDEGSDDDKPRGRGRGRGGGGGGGRGGGGGMMPGGPMAPGAPYGMRPGLMQMPGMPRPGMPGMPPQMMGMQALGPRGVFPGAPGMPRPGMPGMQLQGGLPMGLNMLGGGGFPGGPVDPGLLQQQMLQQMQNPALNPALMQLLQQQGRGPPM